MSSNFNIDELKNAIKVVTAESIEINKNKCDQVCPVAFLNKAMINQILPILRLIKEDATKYVKIRDIFNEKIRGIPEKVMSDINKEINKEIINEITNKQVNIKIDMQIMSSYASKTNLIDESDIDIGLLIDQMNDEKLNIIDQVLKKCDFKFVKIMHQMGSIYNRYHVYNKIVDGIDIEIKVRDLEKTQTILELHKYLDTKLTEEETTLFTYGKYLLKNTVEYDRFKMLIYNYAFFNLENYFFLII